MATDIYDVFISYSRADYKDDNNNPLPNNVISRITNAFKKNDITYWIDENGIYTGDNFAPKIAKAIKNSSIFVSTENSNNSIWAQSEVSVAQQFKKPIMPIKCDDSVYATSVIMYLASLDYCDYRNNKEEAIKELVESVKDKLNKVSIPNKTSKSEDEQKNEEEVIKSINELNHQFVDISQIAISQVLEANERNRETIIDVGKMIRSTTEEESSKVLNIVKENHILHHNYVRDSLEYKAFIENNFRTILQLMDETRQELCLFSDILKETLEEQRKINLSLQAMIESNKSD